MSEGKDKKRTGENRIWLQTSRKKETERILYWSEPDGEKKIGGF